MSNLIKWFEEKKDFYICVKHKIAKSALNGLLLRMWRNSKAGIKGIHFSKIL